MKAVLTAIIAIMLGAPLGAQEAAVAKVQQGAQRTIHGPHLTVGVECEQPLGHVLDDGVGLAKGLLRSGPRIAGIVQNAQCWLHPSPMRR